MGHTLIMIGISAKNLASSNIKSAKFHLEVFEISLFENKQSFMIFSSFVKHCKVLDQHFKGSYNQTRSLNAVWL